MKGMIHVMIVVAVLSMVPQTTIPVSVSTITQDRTAQVLLLYIAY